MYAIYTTIWGVKLDEELNKKIQEYEITEVCLYDALQNSKHPAYEASVPYSGDDYADFHFGKPLSSDPKDILKEPSDEIKEGFLAFRKEWIALARKEFESWVWDEWDDIRGKGTGDKVKAIAEEFLKALEEGEPQLYRGYSTS